jgi:hypothetical protein
MLMFVVMMDPMLIVEVDLLRSIWSSDCHSLGYYNVDKLEVRADRLGRSEVEVSVICA